MVAVTISQHPEVGEIWSGVDGCGLKRFLQHDDQLVGRHAPQPGIFELDVVAAACDEAAQGQVVAAANDNSPGQIVIAGHREAVDRAGEIAAEKGARLVKPLAVSAPFHCSLMKPAEDRLRVELDKTEFHDLDFPLVNNVEAKAVETGEEAREGLVRQVCAMVCWTGSVRRLTELGVDTFVEVGPGKVLSGLIRRTQKGVTLSNVENGKQVEEHVQA